MAHKLFDQIKVDVETGDFAYPKLPGFKLDRNWLVKAAKRYLRDCDSVELAFRHALHGQLSAHLGIMALAGVWA